MFILLWTFYEIHTFVFLNKSEIQMATFFKLFSAMRLLWLIWILLEFQPQKLQKQTTKSHATYWLVSLLQSQSEIKVERKNLLKIRQNKPLKPSLIAVNKIK